MYCTRPNWNSHLSLTDLNLDNTCDLQKKPLSFTYTCTRSGLGLTETEEGDMVGGEGVMTLPTR